MTKKVEKKTRSCEKTELPRSYLFLLLLLRPFPTHEIFAKNTQQRVASPKCPSQGTSVERGPRGCGRQICSVSLHFHSLLHIRTPHLFQNRRSKMTVKKENTDQNHEILLQNGAWILKPQMFNPYPSLVCSVTRPRFPSFLSTLSRVILAKMRMQEAAPFPQLFF